MAKRYYMITVLISICFLCTYACASLRYPSVEKKLFSWQIPKSKVDTVKNAIITSGYQREGKEDYPYEGAITTLYQKEITTNKIKSRIRILLSFKEAGTNSVFYRNLGITIVDLDRNDVLEISDEVDRIEGLLYEKLLEVAGKENVVRGKRASTGRTIGDGTIGDVRNHRGRP